MSPTSSRAAPPRGAHVPFPGRGPPVNPSRATTPARAASRGAGARAPGPAMSRQGFSVFDGGAGAADGEPPADGAAEGFSAAGEADGVVAVAPLEAWPIRCDLVSASSRPVTLMFSAFW